MNRYIPIIKIYEILRRLRQRYYRFRALSVLGGVPEGIVINGKTVFTGREDIGKNCQFNSFVHTGFGHLTIDDNFFCGTDILVISSNHDYDKGNMVPYGDENIFKDVHIGKNVWIGSRVTILPGSYIEDGVVIQAGAVVRGRLPYCSVCGGNPAKVIKMRDVEHYEKLEKQGRYTK